jgi:hypothetical protein
MIEAISNLSERIEQAFLAWHGLLKTKATIYVVGNDRYSSRAAALEKVRESLSND